MIRRDAGGDFLLITQNDHALLSGQLARQIGNSRFAAPDPFEPTVAGITLHDCGWPLHDDAPTLDARHLPLDVFDAPPQVATRVWAASAEMACQQEDYAGLLVSLHVLRLSDLAVRHAAAPEHRSRSPRDLFDLTQFQQREIARQERLRPKLGLRLDVPLTLGLAAPGTGEADDRLRFDSKLLQAMDTVSLMLCCSELLFPTVEGVLARPGGMPLTLQMSRQGDGPLVAEPWPFKIEHLQFDVPFRRLKAQPYADQAEFQAAYAAARPEILPVRLCAPVL